VLGLIGRRLLSLIPVLLMVSLGVFSLVLLVPGNAAQTLAGGEQATEERIREVEAELGLDDPVIEQYGRWLRGAVVLDFGDSLLNRQSVSGEIGSRFPVTLSIAVAAMTVALLIGVPLGILAGTRPGSGVDKAGVLAASLGVAIPNFWMAIILVSFLAIDHNWLPALGFTRITEDPGEFLRSVTIPAIALGTSAAAALARQLRAGMVDVLGSDYVRTSWALGSGTRTVVGKHGVRNAAIPAVTVMGLQLTVLLGGTVIIERIFSIRGLGTYMYDGVLSYDLPVIQGCVVVFVLVHLLVNLLVDISYGLLNPRVRIT
jgi:peptide/nickel transport system permease protein